MIFKNNYRYSYIFVATLIISYFFYDTNKENFVGNTEQSNNSNNSLFCKDQKEKDTETLNNSVNKNCDEPTCDNLFMNILPTDDFSKKKPACSYTMKLVERLIMDFIINLKG